jgi:type II secretory pathway component HofQ
MFYCNNLKKGGTDMAARGLIFLLIVLVLTVPAVAQVSGTSQDDTVNLDLKDVDVRAAIEALFRGTGKNYAIDPNVSGTVPSVQFRNVPFETALRNLTRSAGLVYRIDNASNIYIISKKPDVSAVTSSVTSQLPSVSNSTSTYVDTTTTEREVKIEKIPLNYASASEILDMLGGGGGRTYGYGGYPSYGYGSYGYGSYPSYGYGSYPSYGYGSYGYGSYPSYGYGNYYGGYYGGIRNYGYGSYGGYGSGYRIW